MRFVDPERAAWAQKMQDDPRSTEQINADSLVQLLKIAGEADPGRVFGGRRPAVRVIVTEKALTAETGEPGAAEPAAHGQIEGNPIPISQETIDRLLCDTGTRGIKFDDIGQIIDVGRDERLFTEAQRAAMGVRDGGCLWVGCDRSPAWSEAHHINEWLTDSGDTNLADGVRSAALPPAPPASAQPALEDHPHRNPVLAPATGGKRTGADTDRTAEQGGGAVAPGLGGLDQRAGRSTAIRVHTRRVSTSSATVTANRVEV
ncbi:DUF222 domain-containing protein [Cryobacterium sp. M23]|uniref:DUF222 domain-containing protein n=1 Tax=Cryobacterium sp. M23 TaxID=2048292 RepID=UPI001304F419|nr:DUF222 domain-containing protein [Cryobacterium sp. M23]